MVDQSIFEGNDIKKVAESLLGCTLQFPTSSFPVKHGVVSEVQWYNLENQDPETTEDKQGDALLTTPGNIFLFEAMGQVVILVSALSEKTRACVRINALQGIAERAHLLTRALGINTINRSKYQLEHLLTEGSFLTLSPEREIPQEVEKFTPKRSTIQKGLRIKK